MENTLKFYLLAEKGGWDASSYAYQYRKTYMESKAYQVLSYNVLEARKHLSNDAKTIVSQFESLVMEPTSLEEAFVLETRLNYLALHSFPEFYLNPLSLDPNYVGQVSSIGDLIVEYENTPYSINELIQDQTISMDRKKEIIWDKTEHYKADMDEIVNESIRIINKRAFAKESNGKELVRSIFDGCMFFLWNFFFLFTLLYPLNPYWECFFNPQYNKVMTYASYLFPIFLFLFDFFFVLFHTYRSKISEPYNYARRFLRKNSGSVYQDIQQQQEKLYDYICGAINNKIILKNDIRDFSKLSTSYVDFNEVLNVRELKKKKTFIVLNSLNYIFETLAGIAFLITFVFFVIGMFLHISF